MTTSDSWSLVVTRGQWSLVSTFRLYHPAMAFDVTFIAKFLIDIFDTISKQPMEISKRPHTVLTINAL